MISSSSTPGRARPLPPDERRATLVEATVPLLSRHGTRVTSRQIAEAAGVAEGTIFRVFEDKDELIGAAIEAVFDPAPALAELDRVDVDLPLWPKLVAVTSVLQRRLLAVFNVMIALGLNAPPEEVDARRQATRPGTAQILARIEMLLTPDRDAFRMSVGEVVRLLRLLTFSGSHPLISDGNLLSADEITDVLLRGVRRESHGGEETC